MSRVPHLLSCSCALLSVWVENQRSNLHHRKGNCKLAEQIQILEGNHCFFSLQTFIEHLCIQGTVSTSKCFIRHFRNNCKYSFLPSSLFSLWPRSQAGDTSSAAVAPLGRRFTRLFSKTGDHEGGILWLNSGQDSSPHFTVFLGQVCSFSLLNLGGRNPQLFTWSLHDMKFILTLNWKLIASLLGPLYQHEQLMWKIKTDSMFKSNP